ncbi:unnamed protein product [Dracunculus medinensis]|uniref:Uncharacterized protein n=1 Tax=Dracunculus medinensis TaxID=318479 RepID=A0A0N4UK50_DRAME|nr:unnamed protein product [Dracunculus medinensis]
MIDWIMGTACRHSRSVQISPEHRITDLEDADDAVLFVESYDEIQIMLNNVSTTAARIALRISSIRASPSLVRAHRRPPQELTHVSLFAKPCDDWRQKRGGPINTWTDTVRKDFERIGPAIYGLRRWKKEWLPLLSTMASDHTAWKRLTLVDDQRYINLDDGFYYCKRWRPE